MATRSEPQAELGDMPAAVQSALTDLVAAAQSSFQDDLASIVLFGSGAEGRLRPTSDVNLLFVLRQFRHERADAFRESLRLAYVAARVAAMFVVETELTEAAELFAAKFGDIARRHRVLYGEFPATLGSISAQAKRRQLLEMLMNLTLRLRRNYLFASLHEERLAAVVAETSGPLRVAAATLLELEGQQVVSPKASLERFVSALDAEKWRDVLTRISEARETGELPAGEAAPLVFRIMEMVDALRRRAEGSVEA